MFNSNHKAFFVSNTLVAFANAIVAIFFNVSLYRYTNNSLEMMVIFNALKYLIVPLFFFVGSYLTNKVKINHLYSTSILVYILMIMVMITADSYISNKWITIILIALIWGIADGLYWLSFNGIQQLITSDELRSRFISMYSALAAIACIIAPAVSSYLLLHSGNGAYVLIFIIAAMSYFLASISIAKISLAASGEKINYKRLKDAVVLDDVLMNFSLGFKEAVGLSFLGILYVTVFNHHDLMYSLFSTAIAITGVLGNYLSAHVYKNDIKKRYFISSSLLIIGCGCFFGIQYSILSALIYGIVSNLLAGLHYVPIAVKSFNLINEKSTTSSDVYGLLTIREFAINIGRITSLMLAYYLMIKFEDGILIAFMMSHVSIICLMAYYLKDSTSSQVKQSRQLKHYLKKIMTSSF